MKRASTIAAVATAGLAMALPVAANPTSASADGPDSDRSETPGKGATSWTKVSDGPVPQINEAGLYRTPDGVLHIAYGRGSGGTSTALAWSNVSKHGKLLDRGTILSGWESVSYDPKLVQTPGNGIRVVFDGLDPNGGAPYDEGLMYTATAEASGKDWTLAPGAMTFEEAPGYGTGAVALPNDMPVVAFPNGRNDIYWRQADGTTSPTTPDNHIGTGGSSSYYTALARDAKDGQVVLGWYGNGGGKKTNGIFVNRLVLTPKEAGQPRMASTVKAPRSSSLDPNQTVALTGRRAASGVYSAYCVGYPTCKQISLWRVGAKNAIAVPKSKGADHIAIAAAPQGRLWVVWTKEDTNRVYATLSNKQATRFGPVRMVKGPRSDIYGVSAHSEAVRHLDLVINTGSALYHRQLLPGLKLTAMPQRFHNNKRHIVTFRVTDAGSPMGGATVRVAGKTKQTGAKGKVQIAFRKGIKPRRYHATAAKPSYAKGHVTVRVLR